MSRPRCPYPGPRPFELDERDYFFGRDREAREIVSLAMAHEALLLYAESGAGKTSLLNTKVMPLLSERGVDVIGTTRVSGELPPGVSGADIKNIYAYHAILGLQPPTPQATSTPLRDWFSRTSPPASSIQAHQDFSSLTSFIAARPKPKSRRGGEIVPPRVIVFDQFEEIFTTGSDRWTDRGDFFDDLGEALENDLSLRVLLVMREEFVAALDPYAAAFPRRLRVRYRLERLRRSAALLAVTEPLKNTGYEFQPGVAESLVDALLRAPRRGGEAERSGQVQDSMPVVGGESPASARAIATAPTAPNEATLEFIEPVQLQVVCVELWNSLPDPPAQIDHRQVTMYADVDRALASYYESCLRLAIGSKPAQKADITELTLRHWFENALITPERTRGTVYAGADQTGGLPTPLVDLLDRDYRLVRPELRGAAKWYELTHDRFINPILESNRRFFFERSGAGVAKKIVENSKRWAAQGRHNRDLLRGWDLQAAAEWQKVQGKDGNLSAEAQEFLQASITRDAILSRVTRTIVPIVGVAVFALGGWAVMWRQNRNLENAILSERGAIATVFTKQRGHEFDGLLLGLRAVGPALQDGRVPPDSAVDGLRAALRTLGPGLWLFGASPINSAQVSRDGATILTVGDTRITLWDSTGRQLFSEATQATTSDTLQRRNVRTEISYADTTSETFWTSARLSPDGQLMVATKAVARGTDSVSRLRSATRLPFPARRPQGFAGGWSEPSARAIALRTIDTLRSLERALRTSNALSALGFTSDSRRVLVGSLDGRLLGIDREATRPPSVFPGSRTTPNALITSPKDTRIALSYVGRFELLDANTGELLLSFVDKSVAQWTLAFTPNDSLLVAISAFGADARPVRLFDARTGKLIKRLERDVEDGLLLMSKDGSRIATVFHSFDGTEDGGDSVVVWRLDTRRIEREMQAPPLFHTLAVGRSIALMGKYNGTSPQTLATWDVFSSSQLMVRTDLPTLDQEMTVNISGDDSHVTAVAPTSSLVRVFRLDGPVATVDSLTPKELHALGCKKLRARATEWALARQSNLCMPLAQ